MASGCDRYLRLCVLGDFGVGKTSIVMRFVHHTYTDDDRSSPVGYRIRREKTTIQIRKKYVEFHLVDGYDASSIRLSPTCYTFRRFDGCILVYDISKWDTFNHIMYWRDETAYRCADALVIVMGNKCDLEKEREVTREMGEEMAADIGAIFFEVSAKTDANINEAFQTLATKALGLIGLDYAEKLSECRSRAATVEMEKMRMASLIKQLPNEIKALRTQRANAERKAGIMRKKANKLNRHIENDYQRVQSAVEAVAESRSRAHTAEEGQRAQRERMVDMELRVREIERRAAELETQLRRTGGRERGRDHSFWAVEVEEVELTEEVLGRGSWATVYMARFRGLKVAAKCMHSLNVSDYNQRLFAREMSIAATIRHPNLIQFIGATVQGHPIILTELMSTSLRAELEKQPLSPDQISSISLDVARALLYLHLMQPDPIIHRDISSANVLLNSGPDKRWLAKVSDYGSANYLQHVTTCGPGNPSYAAPEAAIPVQQSTKMDVYSYGVLLLEMWSRKFPEKSEHQVLLQGLRREEVREMVQRCLKHDPLRRPEMTEVVEHLQ